MAQLINYNIIIWLGCIFLLFSFIAILRILFKTSFKGFFVDSYGNKPNISRIALLISTLYLSSKFIFELLDSGVPPKIDILQGSYDTFLFGVPISAYLLSKITNGNISNLFLRKNLSED